MFVQSVSLHDFAGHSRAVKSARREKKIAEIRRASSPRGRPRRRRRLLTTSRTRPAGWSPRLRGSRPARHDRSARCPAGTPPAWRARELVARSRLYSCPRLGASSELSSVAALRDRVPRSGSGDARDGCRSMTVIDKKPTGHGPAAPERNELCERGIAVEAQ